MGKLFLVATPIGNLGDISPRALETLKTVQLIACEDTRQTRKLTAHFDIKTSLFSLHDHSGRGQAAALAEKIAQGQTVAYVTDNGMPSISDPGFTLVREVLARGGAVEAVPGPSAGITALAASGIPCERFIFEGFLPQKSGARKKRLEALRDEERTLIFYESPHRVLKTLRELSEIFGARPACLARELTKKFEEYIRGTLPEVLRETEKRSRLGEIVLIVQGKRDKDGVPESNDETE